jgi:cyclopropane-fatty-acyl-phospholipid synthase
MYEFYLAAAEMTFRHGSAMVFQMQLAHIRDATRSSRDYITDANRAAKTNPKRKRGSREYSRHRLTC